MRILNNLDLRQNQLLQAVVHNLAVAPENPVAGQIYFNTADNKFYGYGANGWVDLSYSFDDGDIQKTLTSLEEKITAEINRATAKEGELDAAIKANASSISELKTTVEGIDSDLDAEVLRATTKENELHDAIEANKAAQDLVNAAKADKTYVDSQLSNKVDSSKLGNGASQIPVLDEHGKLNMSTIPTLAVNETKVAEDIDAALALNQKSGDIVIINPNSKQIKAITEKYAVDQLNAKQGFKVLEANVLSDEYAAYLAEGKTTYICVDPDAESFEDRYRPLNSIADTMTRGEIEKELAKKDTIESVNSKIQEAKEYANTQIDSAKTELNGTITSTKETLEESISEVDNKADANAGEITAIKEAATQLKSTVDSHVVDNEKHITSAERNAWNVKTDKKVFDIGDGAKKEFEITHGLESEDVIVSVKDAATKEMVFTDVKTKDENTIVISFAKAPTLNEFRVVVVG